MHFDLSKQLITGPSGQLAVHPDDQVAQRLAMLIEGQCEGLGAAQAAAKHGLSVQRYFQLLRLYREQGAGALQSRKPGPKANYVRTEEVTRQVIRHRFLDPDASTAVIAQKMRQAGFPVSSRSVDRIVEEFGLQKKTLSLPTPPGTADPDAGQQEANPARAV
jgi:transposase